MAKKWSPPRGIGYLYLENRPSPYMLRWRESGRTKTQVFDNELDRELAAKALAEKREQFGKEVLTFDPVEWRDWLQAKEQLEGADLLTVIREWKEGRREAKVTESVKVADAIKSYLEMRSAEKLSPDTIRHITKHVGQRFGAFAGDAELRAVDEKMINEWLAGLLSSKGALKGKPVDPLTRRHHRKDLNTFLDYCVRRQWIDRNPCEFVPVPAVEEEDVELLTVDEGRRLFEKNKGHAVIARLALEAFGFLRASSAGRIRKEQINFAEKGIRLVGAEHKSGKTKYRQGHPDNLWKWLALGTDETWSMDWWKYRNEKALAFARAEITGSENRLRKTCLSAHLAWLKNQPLTSYLAQHRHTSTTDIYLGVMSEADGKKWFEIVP